MTHKFINRKLTAQTRNYNWKNIVNMVFITPCDSIRNNENIKKRKSTMRYKKEFQINLKNKLNDY